MSAPSRVNVASARKFAQPRLGLGWRPVSREATALVAECMETIVLPRLPSQQRRPSSLAGIEAATSGTWGGLIAALASQGDGWARRPMAPGTFTAEPGVSYRQFLKVRDALLAAGLIEHAPGYLDRSGPVARGAETRLRLTDKGRGVVASFGLAPRDVGLHFANAAIAEGGDQNRKEG